MDIRSIMIKSFKGEEKLVKVFWIYGVLASTIFVILMAIIFGGIFGHSIRYGFGALAGIAFGFGFIIQYIILGYYSWLGYSIWQCSKNTNNEFYTILVKISVIAGIILLISC